MIVDIHAHALNEAFLVELMRTPCGGIKTEADGNGGFRLIRADGNSSKLDPLLHRQDVRLTSLKRRKVDRQFISPPPGVLSWPGGAVDAELSRSLNSHCAIVASQGEGRLEAVGTIAFGEAATAAYELERAVDKFGFRCIIIPTTAGGKPLDDPEFEPIFSLAEKLDLVLFMHPTVPASPDRFGIHEIQVLVGLPFETTLAVTRMIFSGFFNRHAQLKLLLAHGGGNLIFMQGRLDAAFLASGFESNPYLRKHATKPPSAYLKNLYFDSCVVHPGSLNFLAETVGTDRILFGTDYPYEIGDPEGAQSLLGLGRMAGAQSRDIRGKNAVRILKQRGS